MRTSPIAAIFVIAGLTCDAHSALFFPPDPNPNTINPRTIFLQEITTAPQNRAAFYKNAAGTLVPIPGMMIPLNNGGGVEYDLTAVAPNFNLVIGDLVLNDDAATRS